MTDYQAFLLKLHQNLAILKAREAKYGGNAPLELLNQIEDHEQAITLTEQVKQDQLTEVEWRAALKPLLIAIDSRSGDAETVSSVTIGDIEGGIHGSKIAGRDIVENIFQIVNQTIPRPLLIVISVAIFVMVVLGVANIEPVRVAMFATATPTITPIPTATPLPFAPAAENETLILIVTFYHTEGVADTDAHNEIRRAIEAARDDLGVKNLRIEVEPTRLPGDDQDKARELGERYRASIIIWGSDTGVRVTVNFLNLKDPDYDAGRVKIDETERTQFANPSAYARFIIEDLPGSVTFLALFAVGKFYYNQADYPQAIGVIEKAVAALPSLMPLQGAAEAYVVLALLYMNHRQYDQSVVAFTKAIELNYDPLALPYNNRGNVYKEIGNYQQAFTDYNKAIELDPEFAYAYANRGNVYLDIGHYLQAVADYNKVMELDPKDGDAYNNRGIAYHNIGFYLPAIADYDKAIELNPKRADAYFNRGYVYEDLGNYQQAITSYNKAIELDPTYVDAYNNRGNAYEDLGNYQQAITNYSKAIELDLKHTSAYFNRGNVYLKQGDYQKAMTDFIEVTVLAPNHAEAWAGLCRVGGLTNLLAEVMYACEQAVKLDPDDGRPRNSRGLARALIGDYQGAIEDFRFYVKWSKQNYAYEPYGRRREVWIAELQAGRNPFDDATLEELRKE